MTTFIPPNIVLLDSHWPGRALLRAQLIEEGFEVVSTDQWSTAKSYVEALLKPRLVIVDLQGLTDAELVLDELEAHMPPERVLILSALGAIPVEQLRARGFNLLARPVEVRNIVGKVAELARPCRT
jgi:DNA-binding response OmpR family regulator